MGNKHSFFMDTIAQTSSIPAFTVSEVLRKGWEITKKYWAQYLVFGLIVLALYIPVSILGGLSQEKAWAFIMFLVNVAYQTVIMIATVRLVLLAVDGKQIVYRDLFKIDPMHALYVFGTMLLLAIVVGIGFIVLIIPGIILALMFALSIYVAVEKNMNPIDAMKASKALTDGNKGNIFLFWLAIAGLNIAIVAIPLVLVIGVGSLIDDLQAAVILGIVAFVVLVIPFIIANFVLGMVSAFGFGYIYRKLTNKNPGALRV